MRSGARALFVVAIVWEVPAPFLSHRHSQELRSQQLLVIGWDRAIGDLKAGQELSGSKSGSGCRSSFRLVLVGSLLLQDQFLVSGPCFFLVEFLIRRDSMKSTRYRTRESVVRVKARAGVFSFQSEIEELVSGEDKMPGVKLFPGKKNDYLYCLGIITESSSSCQVVMHSLTYELYSFCELTSQILPYGVFFVRRCWLSDQLIYFHSHAYTPMFNSYLPTCILSTHYATTHESLHPAPILDGI